MPEERISTQELTVKQAIELINKMFPDNGYHTIDSVIDLIRRGGKDYIFQGLNIARALSNVYRSIEALEQQIEKDQIEKNKAKFSQRK